MKSYISLMKHILDEQQKREVIAVLEEVGAEFGIQLNENNIMLGNDPMTIIYNHEVVGSCKAQITTDYLANRDKEALRECMRKSVSKMQEQLERQA